MYVRTQYHLAARTGCLFCVQILIRAGMDPYQPTEAGELALDIARRQFKRPIVNLLMDEGRVQDLKTGGLALLPSTGEFVLAALGSESESGESEEADGAEEQHSGSRGSRRGGHRRRRRRRWGSTRRPYTQQPHPHLQMRAPQQHPRRRQHQVVEVVAVLGAPDGWRWR